MLYAKDEKKSRSIPLILGVVIVATVIFAWISAVDPVQADIVAMRERGDVRSALIKYAPEQLSFIDGAVLSVEELRLQALYSTDEQGERKYAVGAFVEQPAGFDYGPHLKLVSAGIDPTPVEVSRVRLDWQIAKAASVPITIQLRYDDGETVEDNFEARVFRAGEYSTYHVLPTTQGATLLHITVIISDGTAGDHTVALTLN